MLRVLIVEDSPDIQRRLREMLEAVPAVRVVACVDTAAKAIERTVSDAPDVVVLDVALRDGDRGYTVLRALARRCPCTQVIVLSNFGWNAMRDGFLRAGARAYFDKAFEFRKARDWIAEQAAGKAANEAAPSGDV